MEDLEKIGRLVKYYCLLSTSTAGSGHLTSSLSAADLMTVLFFGGFFRFDAKNPDYPENDRIIFSKGHASPLFYSLWTVAGQLSEQELLTYRKFGSHLEGHPSMEFKYTEAPTGSLGQGLSVGVGLSLAAKMDKFKYKTFVLIGDGEMSEGQNYEAIQLASFYNLNNLVAIVDVNRLGQSGETMLGHSLKDYQNRFRSFGWESITIDGHDLNQIAHAYSMALTSDKPIAIIAKTLKGKGLKDWEDKNGFHAKTIPYEKIGEASKEFGEIDKTIRGVIAKPRSLNDENFTQRKRPLSNVAEYKTTDLISTRKAYGDTLVKIFPTYPSIVVLDAEVSNSTFSEAFSKKFPESFREMFIAEQNMVGVAIGLARRGKIPFSSTFSAFWTRAHDQLRMAAYSKQNLKFVGSHAGVSIGPDGASQMGLEDIAMFRSLFGSVVLYPSDAVSSKYLTEEAVKHPGLGYLRMTRMDTPIIYDSKEKFEIGGSKILKKSKNDRVSVVAAGVTLHETLKAYEDLKKEKINIRVIDLYSIKPIDSATLKSAAEETDFILVVEDHYEEGGMSEAVRSSLINQKPIHNLSVKKMPRSGTPEELVNYEEIGSSAIVQKVKELLR